MASPAVQEFQAFTNNGNVTGWTFTTPSVTNSKWLCMAILAEAGGSYCNATSITDGSGITWVKRQEFNFIVGSHSSYYHLSLWYASLPSTSNTGHSITVNLDALSDALCAVVFGIGGTNDLNANPFDPNPSLLTNQKYSDVAFAACQFSTSNGDDLVLCLVGGFRGDSPPGPAGFTQIAGTHTNHANFCGINVLYNSVSSIQTNVTETMGDFSLGAFIDAVTADYNHHRHSVLSIGGM